MYDDTMIREMADLLRNIATKARGRGMRISFEWLRDILDGDERLTRRVLTAAGFAPPTSTEWSYGRGEAHLAQHAYPEGLADRLTDILDDFEPA
jgi:hypothetical protein